MSAPQPARRIALDVIMAVSQSDSYANLLLPARLARAKLSAADAGLATELTYGTLRMQGYYDAVIAASAGRPVDDLDPAILDVLRLACHQLLSMRVPQHAAVDESVELAKTVGSRSAVGFVNAVLRTVTRTTPEAWRDRLVGAARSGEDALAIEQSHPLWIVRAFRQALTAEGRESELPELLAADNVAAKVTIALLPGLAADARAASAGVGVPTRYSPVGAILGPGDPAQQPIVASGRARVQDEGSQLAALILARARPVAAGERWLDMCAGPGGKAALLAAEAATQGAELVANEIVPARARLVRNSLAVLAHPPTVWELDGRDFGRTHPGEFDRILLDAPCTGLGALRRRPEARWRKQPADVAQLGTLQSALLAAGLEALSPGGILAYVTCSPHPAETKSIVAAALRIRPDVERIDTVEVAQRVALHELDLASGPHVQLWPHRHGTDAMFVQLLEKAGPGVDRV